MIEAKITLAMTVDTISVGMRTSMKARLTRTEVRTKMLTRAANNVQVNTVMAKNAKIRSGGPERRRLISIRI